MVVLGIFDWYFKYLVVIGIVRSLWRICLLNVFVVYLELGDGSGFCCLFFDVVYGRYVVIIVLFMYGV